MMLATALVGVAGFAAAAVAEVLIAAQIESSEKPREGAQAVAGSCSFIDVDMHDTKEDVVHLDLIQRQQRVLLNKRGPSQFRIYSMQDADISDDDNSGVLMNHLAKTGGSYVKRVLKELFKGNMSHLDLQKEAEELAPMNWTDGDRQFIIGLVRNPFDYYVSLWGFTSNRTHCCFRNALNRHEQEHLAKTTPWGEKVEDRARFQEFLRDISHEDLGVESLRFYGSYLRPEGVATIKGWQNRKANDPAVLRQKDIIHGALEAFNTESGPIDCWIQTETIEADLRKCLRLYEQTKGAVPVDWDKLNEIATDMAHNHADHVPCSTLYTDESLKLVAHIDRHILRAFGYAAKCFK